MRNSALEAYIGNVAAHLKASGYPVPDWHANDDDPRDGAIHLSGDREEDGQVEVWIGWTEESGWYRGIDRTGDGLSCIRWAWIDVLATPHEVRAWLQRAESTEMAGWEMNRPRFRDFDDEDGFEEELTAAASSRGDAA